MRLLYKITMTTTFHKVLPTASADVSKSARQFVTLCAHSQTSVSWYVYYLSYCVENFFVFGNCYACSVILATCPQLFCFFSFLLSKLLYRELLGIAVPAVSFLPLVAACGSHIGTPARRV
jgi:hypothetical protein